jgi:acetolactate synthase-1/2/3 large subunit
MLTGVCCAYTDSVPVIYITGQVATFRLKRDTGVRQMGFQETETVAIYKPVTKYAVLVDDPTRIRYEMEKACFMARSGRPGPVVVDIPDDIQRQQINPDELEPFIPPPETKDLGPLAQQVDECVSLLEQARRPVIILGWGIRLAKAERDARSLVDQLNFPVTPTWAMMDFLPAHPLVVGGIGTHGTRYGNFTVQNSDLLLAIGTRLDTHGAGPLASFAREAKKIVVDIDLAELNKFPRFGMQVDLPIQADARDFLQLLLARLAQGIKTQDLTPWKQRIAVWKAKYPICLPQYEKEEHVNPYVFMRMLSQESSPGDVFVLDTGCAVAWMMQAFEFKEGQRCFHAFNTTAMGYGLPGSIGASIALDGRPITLVTGDGSLQMSLYELATVIRHRLPIKILMINNHGYGMIQQTQDQWLNSRYEATTSETGLAFPDFVKVARAYGFQTVFIDRNRHLRDGIREALASEGPVFCNVEISAKHRVIPQVKFGRPIEDSEPLLRRSEFLENMLVKPLPESLVPNETQGVRTRMAKGRVAPVGASR